jgi:hypothetical protein
MRKMGVAVLLSSGLFIIVSAIVRVVLTIHAEPSVININRWGFRETIVGLITVTAPVLCPFFTREFWHRGPYRRGMAHRVVRDADLDRIRDRPDFGNWLGTVDLRSALGEGDDFESQSQSSNVGSVMKRHNNWSWAGEDDTVQQMYGRQIYEMQMGSNTQQGSSQVPEGNNSARPWEP